MHNESYSPYDGRENDPLSVIETDLDRLERFVGEFPDDALFRRPTAGEGLPAIGNLVLHLAGATQDWLAVGVLGRSVDRDRALEFSQTEGTREELMGAFQTVRALLRDVRAAELDPAQPVKFRGKERSVGYMILQTVEHVGYHLGQAAFLRKLVAGLDRNFP